MSINGAALEDDQQGCCKQLDLKGFISFVQKDNKGL